MPASGVLELADVSASSLAKVYVFQNGVRGGGPFGFQPDVFDSAPGDPGCRPLRSVELVTWKPGVKPKVLRSAAEIEAAAARGEIKVESSGVVVNMPFLNWPGGPLIVEGVGDEDRRARSTDGAQPKDDSLLRIGRRLTGACPVPLRLSRVRPIRPRTAQVHQDCQSLGLSLDDIREILALRERGDAPCTYVRGVIDRQAREVERRIEELQRLRIELRRLRRVARALPDEIRDERCVCHIIENEALATRES